MFAGFSTDRIAVGAVTLRPRHGGSGTARDDDIDIHGDRVASWRPWVRAYLDHQSIPSGHHQTEEAPEAVASALLAFLG